VTLSKSDPPLASITARQIALLSINSCAAKEAWSFSFPGGPASNRDEFEKCSCRSVIEICSWRTIGIQKSCICMALNILQKWFMKAKRRALCPRDQNLIIEVSGRYFLSGALPAAEIAPSEMS
jgi:hypothetical protein